MGLDTGKLPPSYVEQSLSLRNVVPRDRIGKGIIAHYYQVWSSDILQALTRIRVLVSVGECDLVFRNALAIG